MTYWPISSPSVYAASTQKLSEERSSTSHDGAESVGGPETGHHKEHQVAREDNGHAVTEDLETNAPGGGKVEQGKQQTEKGDSEKAFEQPEEDVSGNIIGIKSTRSGHMFATITQSTLTIWQTKVFLCSTGPASVSNGLKSLQLF